MKVAIVGCAHGELDKIYSTATQIENQRNEKIDLLICCGDFQATRNESDLRCMAVPEKFYNMGSFYRYYSGEKEAPIMTIFIGGNHEASNYLQELPYGGWVAPKIYYMGYAGVVSVGNLRIGGLSGIFKPFDYRKGHYESAPYNKDTKRSVYHVRNIEVFRLKQISGVIDVMLSHDWPRGVYNYGCIDELLKNKPFFRNEVNENKLGSEPCEELLFHLKPKYWFSAHLHTKFSALVPHKSNNEADDEKIDSNTQFLALDKCLPRRKYIEVIEVPSNNDGADIELSYDLEWLTILYLTDHLMSSKRTMQYMPGPTSRERWSFTPTAEEKEFVFERMGKNLRIPVHFQQTTQAYENNRNRFSTPRRPYIPQPKAMPNSQTIEFCLRLGITDPLSSLLENINVTNPDQASFSNELIPDLTSTPDNFMRKRKFSYQSFDEHSNYSSFNESREFASFNKSDNVPSFSESTDFPSYCESNDSPSVRDTSDYLSFKEPNDSSKDVSDFPSFKETKDESSSEDLLPFQIDRVGTVPAAETPVIEKKQFKRRNGSMYQDY